MPKRRRQRRPEIKGDPLADLPNAPAMRAHLVVQATTQHRRGTGQARRVPPGSIEWLHRQRALTDVQHAAAVAYEAWCRRMRPTPSPRSCIPTPKASGSPVDEETAARNARSWREIRAVVLAQGRQPAAYLDALCWHGETITAAHKLDALRAALDALVRHWRLGA